MMKINMSQAQLSQFKPMLADAWSHIQHELLYVSWGLIEIALFAPLSFSFLPWARYWPPGQIVLWLLLIMFLPFNLARLLTLLRLPPTRQQTIMALALTTTILAAIRSLIYAPESFFNVSWLGEFFANLAESGNQLWLRDVAIFLLVTIMWWRGLRLVNRQFDINQTGFRLRLGILVAPLAIWFSHIGLNWNITPFILLFFLAGLMAIALIRAEEVEQARTSFSASLSPRWLGLIFIASLLVVSLSGLLAAIVSGESLFAIAGWLTPLLRAFRAGGAIIVATVFYLLRPFINLLALIIDQLALWLQRVLGENWFEPQLRPTLDFSDLVATPEATEVVDALAPPNVPSKILAVLIMIAVVLLVSLALGRLFRQATFAARDSEIIRDRKQEDDLSLVQRLRRRLGFWRQWQTAVSIRRVYRQMLQAAAASGYPRSQSDTPYEYLATLAEVWPEHTADSQLITQAFVKVRYGQLPETEAELAAIESAWQRLKNTRPAMSGEPPLLENNQE